MTADADARLRAAIELAVHQRLGLVFSESRRAAFDRAIDEAAASLTRGSASMLLAALQQEDAAVVERLADQLTIQETYFFRDARHFAAVDAAVSRAASAGRPARLWSAGCSTGEEAYSLAMRALAAPGSAAAGVEVIGTDVTERPLAAARRAVYGPRALREVGEELRAAWFEATPQGVRPVEAVRRCVRFARANLMEPGNAPAGMDLVFCRNVFIYFDADAIARALETLIRGLAPDGVLVLGPSDPLVRDPRLVVDQSLGFIAYARAPQAVTAPRAPHVAAPPALRLRSAARPRHDARAGAERPGAPVAEPLDRARRMAEARVLADRGELARARALLQDADGDAEALLLRAFVEQALGNGAGALKDARALTASPSAPALAHVIEAVAAVEIDGPAAARAAIAAAREKLSALEPGSELGCGAALGDALATLRALESRLAPRRRRRGGGA